MFASAPACTTDGACAGVPIAGRASATIASGSLASMATRSTFTTTGSGLPCLTSLVPALELAALRNATKAGVARPRRCVRSSSSLSSAECQAGDATTSEQPLSFSAWGVASPRWFSRQDGAPSIGVVPRAKTISGFGHVPTIGLTPLLGTGKLLRSGGSVGLSSAWGVASPRWFSRQDGAPSIGVVPRAKTISGLGHVPTIGLTPLLGTSKLLRSGGSVGLSGSDGDNVGVLLVTEVVLDKKASRLSSNWRLGAIGVGIAATRCSGALVKRTPLVAGGGWLWDLLSQRFFSCPWRSAI